MASTSPASAATPSATEESTAPPRAKAFLYWLKLGFISFGGPAGQISMMHQELVERQRWISEHRFLHALNYTMVLPGPEAQQLATYMGWLMHGTWGGIVAGSLFVLPSLVLLSSLAWIYLVFGDVTAVAGILYGIKPAVTAIVVFAAWRIGSRALRTPLLWGLAAMAFVAIFALQIPFPAIVVGAGLIGYLGSRLAPDSFRVGGQKNMGDKDYGPALIDDDTPAPPHTRFSWVRTLRFAAIGLGLWAVMLGILIALWGWQGTFTQMGWFFTKAALVTFGGAYAVLPYVFQGGVETYQWLSGPQMIDGLALGETTPGPLIMVVAFVGFLGGWNHVVFGADSVLLAAMMGASVATFFTFLPSFLFIFLGGPLVEASRHDVKFAAPLVAITAAVVGVIINLALFFAYYVLWPQGFSGPFESVAAVIGLGAFVLLFRFQMGIIPLIGICAAVGLLYHLLMPLLGAS
jgi:chromate transporter